MIVAYVKLTKSSQLKYIFETKKKWRKAHHILKKAWDFPDLYKTSQGRLK